ncbi:hypothetical protein Tco_0539716 [Tanacetum coccineum]
MLDRTNYESWSQRIRLYCRGKENGLQILQSIDQGPFKLGTTRDTLGITPEGGVLLGPERPRTYEDLSDTEKKRYDAVINHNIEAKAIWDNVKMLLAGSELIKEDRESQLYDEFERFKMLLGKNQNQIRGMLLEEMVLQAMGAHNRAGNANEGQGKPVKCYNCNGVGHIVRNYTQPKRLQNSNYFKDKMLLNVKAQENSAVLDETRTTLSGWVNREHLEADVDNQPVQDLALNEDNIFQADECDAFDSDVDDELTAQTIFMANLSSAGVTNQDENEIHNEVQQSNVIDSTSVYMGNTNVIPYEQYLSVNNNSVVPSCAPSTLNNVCVSSDNDAFVPHDPIANELKIYKEQVAIYEQRAKFK